MNGDVIMVTINDIAQRMGLSTATISNALSGKGRVSDANRSAVLDKAKEMGYDFSRLRLSPQRRTVAVFAESLDVSFTIPESLGVWGLCIPLSTEWKPSLHEYFGKYKESSPYPMQMSITYISPTNESLIQSVMSAWTFEDMARQWFAFDMRSHRKRQYMPYKVDEEGYVWEKKHDHVLGWFEERTNMTEQEYMSYVRKYHNDMIPEWSR